LDDQLNKEAQAYATKLATLENPKPTHSEATERNKDHTGWVGENMAWFRVGKAADTKIPLTSTGKWRKQQNYGMRGSTAIPRTTQETNLTTGPKFCGKTAARLGLAWHTVSKRRTDI